MKKKRKEIKVDVLFFVIILLIICSSTVFFIKAEGSDSSSTSEWLMFGRTLNHSFWDGNSFSTILGLNNANITLGIYAGPTSPVIVNGYAYIADGASILYQLNASNVSQQINNYSIGQTYSYPLVSNNHVYVIGNSNSLYQLNASNISH